MKLDSFLCLCWLVVLCVCKSWDLNIEGQTVRKKPKSVNKGKENGLQAEGGGFISEERGKEADCEWLRGEKTSGGNTFFNPRFTLHKKDNNRSAEQFALIAGELKDKLLP